MAKVKKIIVDDFLTAAILGDATPDNPVFAFIKNIELIEAKSLPFKSEKDRYELALDLEGENVKWLPNKTSLKSLIRGFETDVIDKWLDKKIKLWTVQETVQGNKKQIVYADIA